MLEKIQNPEDLKKIPVAELAKLAEEIRTRIISVVSKTGGHLASSLGTVDLTIALHYCLNAPTDIIVWDVGHQAYAHKILTGRNSRFDSLRQLNGISGFPNASESIYDPFTTGHSSASVSLACGMALARDLHKRTEKVVAVVGDGSLSGGMCFEALNHAGHAKTDIVVVLNTNEMSISPNSGALSNYMNKIISMPVYNRVKAAVDNFMRLRVPRVGHRLVKLADKFEELLKGLIVPGIFFEELGFRYFGPFDGHDIEAMIHNFKNIQSLKGPILFHVVTKKGKGYKPAEEFPERFHGAAPFEVETGCPSCASPQHQQTYTQVFRDAIVDRAQHNPKIVAITAAMPSGTGLDLFAEKFPERFFDVGIAEGHAVGCAGGLAKGGFKPVVAIYSTFLQRAYDQINEEICLQNLPVVLCLDRAGVVGEDGATHHGLLDMVYLRSLPGMVVMAPSSKQEFHEMLDFAIAYHGPIALRYPRAVAAHSNTEPTSVLLGKSEVIAQGKSVALCAVGSMVATAMEVRALLAKQHIDATVVNARFVKPIDEELLDELFETHDCIVTLEEGSVRGGFGSAVLDYAYAKTTPEKKSAALMTIGFPDEFVTFGSRKQLFELYQFSAHHITQRVLEFVGSYTVHKTKVSSL